MNGATPRFRSVHLSFSYSSLLGEDYTILTNILPGTQMTLVLNGKGLLLEGSNSKIEDKQVPGSNRLKPPTRKHLPFFGRSRSTHGDPYFWKIQPIQSIFLEDSTHKNVSEVTSPKKVWVLGSLYPFTYLKPKWGPLFCIEKDLVLEG